MLITIQLDIQAPIESAFSYLDDNEKQKEWMPGLEETEYLTTYDPANPVGVKFKQRLREGKRIQEYEGQVTEYQKNKLLGIRLYHSKFVIDVIYRLEEITDKSCRLYLTEKIEAKTLFGKCINVLFKGMMKRMFKKQMTSFKESAEKASN